MSVINCWIITGIVSFFIAGCGQVKMEDKNNLTGSWKHDSTLINGKRSAANGPEEISFEKDSTYYATYNGGDVIIAVHGTYKIIGSSNLVLVSGQNKNNSAPSQPINLKIIAIGDRNLCYSKTLELKDKAGNPKEYILTDYFSKER